LALGPHPVGNLQVMRHLRLDSANGLARFAEVLTNTSDQPTQATVRIYYKVAQPVQSGELIARSDETNQPTAMVVSDGKVNLGIVAASKDSDVKVTLKQQGGTRNIDVVYNNLEIPPKGTVVLVHAQVRRGNNADVSS